MEELGVGIRGGVEEIMGIRGGIPGGGRTQKNTHRKKTRKRKIKRKNGKSDCCVCAWLIAFLLDCLLLLWTAARLNFCKSWSSNLPTPSMGVDTDAHHRALVKRRWLSVIQCVFFALGVSSFLLLGVGRLGTGCVGFCTWGFLILVTRRLVAGSWSLGCGRYLLGCFRLAFVYAWVFSLDTGH